MVLPRLTNTTMLLMENSKKVARITHYLDNNAYLFKHISFISLVIVAFRMHLFDCRYVCAASHDRYADIFFRTHRYFFNFVRFL